MVILKKEVTECSFNASLHSVSLVTVIAKQDLKVHVGMCACAHVCECAYMCNLYVMVVRASAGLLQTDGCPLLQGTSNQSLSVTQTQTPGLSKLIKTLN